VHAETLWVALAGIVSTIGTWFSTRRGRAAVAQKDEADAAESLSQTVATLGNQVQALYGLLAETTARAMAAEMRAAAAEHEASQLRVEVARLRVQVAHAHSD
jgi:hypothetical protein